MIYNWRISYHRGSWSHGNGREDSTVVRAPTAKDALDMFAVNIKRVILSPPHDSAFNGPVFIELVEETK